jgi:hypothetical protein
MASRIRFCGKRLVSPYDRTGDAMYRKSHLMRPVEANQMLAAPADGP